MTEVLPSRPAGGPPGITSTELEIRWLRWQDAREILLDLRRRVFVEEQGFAPDVLESPGDPDGIHLGAFADGQLVASITGYLHHSGSPALAAFGLPPIAGLTIQWSKRIELASHRGRGITEQFAASMFRYLYEATRPMRLFIALQGPHRGLESHYHRVFGFRRHGEVMLSSSHGEPTATTVMIIEGEARLREIYLLMRAAAESEARRCPVVVPSLVRFLVDDGRSHLLAGEPMSGENLYVAPLSLADELPRLAAQNRLQHIEQQPRLAATPFPPAREGSRLLDIGTGTGVYLALLAKEPRLAGYDVVGIEPAPQLLSYARFAHPELEFRHGTAYSTGEPDASADVVTANFVFIHLRSPDLALLELRRVLRPGGLLYVVDVNDTTFRGPDVIARMVAAHHAHHEGDRTILASLPRRAAEFGFTPVARFATTVRNTGGIEPSFGTDELRLGRMSMWGLLSFMGQRDELADIFQAAQEHYLGSECEISLDIETHVYRKDGDG